MEQKQYLEGRSYEMKIIYLSEEKLQALKEAEKPMTFFAFFTEVKKFLKELLVDPLNAKPSDLLRQRGIDDKMLRQRLQDRGIIVKSEKIDEPYDEEQGKQTSRYYLSYKIPKKDFKKKVRRLYQNLFEQ